MADLVGALAPASAPATALVKDTTTKTFAADVLDESRRQPVLVDFWAPWCGPCRTLSPIIEKAVASAKGAVKLVKMNIDDHPSVAGQLGIQSIPAVIAFVNDQAVDGFIGALPESQVKAFIERVAAGAPPPPGAEDAGPTPEEIVAEGERLLAGGDTASALEVFAEALAVAPQSMPAIAGLARAQLAAGNLEAGQQTLTAAPETSTDTAIVAARAQVRLAAEAAALPDPATLAARVAADPKDYQARFDLAVLMNARGDRTGAADALLEIVARNRSWQEEKARKQLVQFFEAWGPTDEATVAARRRLSSLLFA